MGASHAELQRSIVDLIQRLVWTPSRSGIDDYGAIFDVIGRWLTSRGVRYELLAGPSTAPVALCGMLGGEPGTPAYVLNATVDTAGFGNRAEWARDPVSGEICNGWLHGRGSSDSKAGVAIFCHLVAAFCTDGIRHSNALGFLFDADEHAGGFGGVQAFLDRWTPGRRIAGVLVGYPGMGRVMVGARGFWRATVRVYGTAAHAGSSTRSGVSAVAKAARLVLDAEALGRGLGAQTTDIFPIPPKITATGVRGGGEFSMVPDRCEVDLDVRLTPSFHTDAARASVEALVRALDADMPAHFRSEVDELSSWPAYRLPDGALLIAAMQDAAEAELGTRPPAEVAGPSNVGNLLALHGIQATCGFGVNYRNAHAADECIDLSGVLSVYRAYERALARLLDTLA